MKYIIVSILAVTIGAASFGYFATMGFELYYVINPVQPVTTIQYLRRYKSWTS